jgi:gas vesicle structural protein
MTTALQQSGGGSGSRGLADAIDSILDKGLVLDAYVGVSVVGIELLTINARVVIASVDTYLRFAEATNRLDLSAQQGAGMPELVGDMSQGAAKGKTRGVLEAVGEKVADVLQDKREEFERRGSSRRQKGE